MARRGRCRCGAVLKFAKTENLKQICSRCGSVVRLQSTRGKRQVTVLSTKASEEDEREASEPEPIDVVLEVVREPAAAPPNSATRSRLISPFWLALATLFGLGIIIGVIAWCAGA